MTDPDIEHDLLRLPPDLHLCGVEESPSGLWIELAAVAPAAICPRCGASLRIHSHYRRILADLPCAGQTIGLRVRLRRFFCEQPTCSQRIFVELLSAFASRYAHRTERQHQALQTIGLAGGGRSGARQADRLGMPVSFTTLLRLVRQVPLAEIATPRVLGVDDWARRKGRTYGTLLYDLERHRPVDLLPDRKAASLEQWLRDHPGVEVISRDRAEAYAEGARKGGPDAVQVADRWHLLQNLSETLEAWVRSQKAEWELVLQGAFPPPSDEPVVMLSKALPCPTSAGASVLPAPAPSPSAEASSAVERRSRESRQRRQERYEQVHQLFEHGMNLCQIARVVGVHRTTVRKFLQAETFPERSPSGRQGRSQLTVYRPFLERRFAEGCHNAHQLFLELGEQGYPGGYTQVSAAVAELRQAHQARLAPEEKQPRPVFRPREIIGWLLQRREHLETKDREDLDRLREGHPRFQQADDLIQGFTAMARKRRGKQLSDWMRTVEVAGIPPLKSFAASLAKDEAAVKAGLTLEWSQGPVDGFNIRIKEIKRRLCGRAKFDLLRRLVLQPT